MPHFLLNSIQIGLSLLQSAMQFVECFLDHFKLVAGQVLVLLSSIERVFFEFLSLQAFDTLRFLDEGCDDLV